MLQSCVIVAKLINLRIARQPDQNWAVFFHWIPVILSEGRRCEVSFPSVGHHITSLFYILTQSQHREFRTTSLWEREYCWWRNLIPVLGRYFNPTTRQQRPRHRNMSEPGAGPGVGISLGWPCCHYPGLCLWCEPSPQLASIFTRVWLAMGWWQLGGGHPWSRVFRLTLWRDDRAGWWVDCGDQHYSIMPDCLLSYHGPGLSGHICRWQPYREPPPARPWSHLPPWVAICRKYRQVIMSNVLFHARAGGQ